MSMERCNENDRVASLECVSIHLLTFCDFLFASLGSKHFQNLFYINLFLREQILSFCLTKLIGEDSLNLAVLIKSIAVLFQPKKMLGAFALQKLFTFFLANFRILCLKFNASITNDVDSFEQLGTGK